MARKLTTQYLPHTAREREEQRDALAALARMRRENLPASEAVDIEGTSIAKLEKYVGPALQRRGKDYVARPSDDLVRPPMLILDSKGVRPIEVRGSITFARPSCKSAQTAPISLIPMHTCLSRLYLFAVVQRNSRRQQEMTKC
jgi:hypothetical protein